MACGNTQSVPTIPETVPPVEDKKSFVADLDLYAYGFFPVPLNIEMLKPHLETREWIPFRWGKREGEKHMDNLFVLDIWAVGDCH